MIEIIDTLPQTDVQPAEYQRLLGYPRDRALTDRAKELAQAARAWYAANGRPWVYARESQSLELRDENTLVIDGQAFTSKRLFNTLKQADANAVMLVAVSAGPEVEAEAQRLWLEEKPDEYFFVEIFGSAVVEHLTTSLGARLCGWADARGLAILPHYSPGYPEWDIAQQPKLRDLIQRTQKYPLPGEIEVLDSGMLRPKKSLLAVFGLTKHVDKVRRLTDLVPCENCSFGSCQYRRVPYRRLAGVVPTELPVIEEPKETPPPPPVGQPLTLEAKYSVNPKALTRWVNERVTLKDEPDGSVEALFKYEGTTCSNTGRALHFHYTVKLGPREQGYVITDERCEPAPGDNGYTFMCRYMNNKEHLMVSIANEKPLVGQRLDDVLTWERPNIGAGCYCEPRSRKHKWGIVLETIHYALVKRELAESSGGPSSL